MAQEQKKVLDAKPGDPSFIPGTNMVEGEEPIPANWLLTSTVARVQTSRAHARTNTHTINVIKSILERKVP